MANTLQFLDFDKQMAKGDYQAVKIIREDGVIVNIEPAPDFPQTSEGKLPKEIVSKLQTDLDDFTSWRTNELTTFAAVGIYVLGQLGKFLVAPGKGKTNQKETAVPASQIAFENAGHRLLRKPKDIPTSIDDVQNVFVALPGNSISFDHPKVREIVLKTKGACKIRLGDNEYRVVLIANNSEVAPRLEITIIGWAEDITMIADKFNLLYNEDNPLRWYANVNGMIKMLGICTGKGGPDNFVQTDEICEMKRSPLPDESKPKDVRAEPLAELLERFLFQSCAKDLSQSKPPGFTD